MIKNQFDIKLVVRSDWYLTRYLENYFVIGGCEIKLYKV